MKLSGKTKMKHSENTKPKLKAVYKGTAGPRYSFTSEMDGARAIYSEAEALGLVL